MTESPEQGWTVVHTVDVSLSRRQLEYLGPDGGKRYVTVDIEADTPEMRARISRMLARRVRG